jgi:hypothetical protein
MTTTLERQIRSIREAPKRRQPKAPRKRALVAGQGTRRTDARDAREALVKRVRSYLDVSGG